MYKKIVFISCIFFSILPNQRIKIGFWTSWKIKCGVAIYTEHIVNELNKHGFKTFIYNNKTPAKTLLNKMLADQIDILNIEYEPSLFHFGKNVFKDINEFTNTVKAIKQKKIKVIVTVHMENHNLKELFKVVDYCIYLRPPKLFNLKKASIIPIGAPIFNPLESKQKVREKYNFKDQDKIIATMGFMLPDKNIPEILIPLVPYLKNNPHLKLQLLTSFNNSSLMCTEFSNIEYKKITEIIKNNKLENQIIHLTKFLPQQELNERLWISDIGFLWGNTTSTTSSASIKEFVTSRLPLVITDCPKFSNDIYIGIIKTPINETLFVNAIINMLNDTQKINKLHEQLEFEYSQLNNGKLIEKHIKIFKKVMNIKA